MQNIMLTKGAAKLVDGCVCVRKGERVVIVTDLNKMAIAEVLAAVLYEREAELSICIMEPRSYHGQEPTAPIAAAMANTDVLLMPTTYSLTHTEARRKANQNGARILSLPGYTEDMLIGGGLDADFHSIRSTVLKAAKLFDNAESAHITSSKGTDLTISLKGKRSIYATGVADEPGSWAAPPAIEAAIAPVEDSTTGVLIVDGVLIPGGLVQSEVRIEFSQGKIKNISGGFQADEFRQLLARYDDPNIYYAVELGLGLNPKSKMGKNYLEDETTYGTVHIGLGEGRTFGSTISASAHIDVVLDRPTLELDGKVIVSDRNLLFE